MTNPECARLGRRSIRRFQVAVFFRCHLRLGHCSARDGRTPRLGLPHAPNIRRVSSLSTFCKFGHCASFMA